MRLSAHYAAAAMVVMLLLAGSSVGQTLRRVPVQQVEGPLVGTWHGLSVSMSLDDGSRKTLTDNDGAVSLVISDKLFALRLNTAVLSRMTYVADPSKKPCTIDLKCRDGEMVGIYKATAERLTMSLNDKEKGRPTDFNSQKNGMVLLLRRVHPVSLYTIDADGTNRRRIVTNPEFTFFGSPDWSPDGGKIALGFVAADDGRGLRRRPNLRGQRRRRGLEKSGTGAMPSWSPDGKQLVCSEYGNQNGPQRGIWIMNADGKSRHLIAPNGWGAQWSPKNNEIAYTVNENGGAELIVYDVATQNAARC